jgi:hypothetical protein
MQVELKERDLVIGQLRKRLQLFGFDAERRGGSAAMRVDTVNTI